MTTTTALNIITIETLLDILKRREVAEFWNALTDDYFKGELIPGSRWVPVDRVGREAAALPKDTAIVVYCSDPKCPNSKQAGEKLKVLGFTNVKVFEGGLEVWKASGRGVELLPRQAAA